VQPPSETPSLKVLFGWPAHDPNDRHRRCLTQAHIMFGPFGGTRTIDNYDKVAVVGKGTYGYVARRRMLYELC
jgi:hypothetical protein